MGSARGFAVFLAFMLAGLSPTAAATLNRPAWTAGDFWTYRTATALTPGLNLTGTITSSVQGTELTPVPGGSVDAYRIVVAGSGTAAGVLSLASGNVTVRGSWILTGEERFDAADLGLLYNLLDLSVNGTYQNIVPFTLRVQNTTTFQIVANHWQYPLAAGTNGSQTVEYNFTQDVYGSSTTSHTRGSGEWSFGFAIAAPTVETVPAGTFDAYAITQTWPDGSRTQSFASPQVGNAVRTESYSPDGNLTGVTTLTAYRYQALEAPTYLGLTAVAWVVVVAVVAAGVVAFSVWYRYRRRAPRPPAGPPDPGFT